ncbi:MAG: hypothetical protein IJP63_06090 [Acholeplasmatales bacterium]|nr:hypothetical protein [Acholeplasmatales bacterium]
MISALLVKKDDTFLIELDETKINDDEYMCNLLGINKTMISSVVRTINDCYFRIYCQDFINRDVEWFSSFQVVNGKYKMDIPEEAIFIPVNQFVDADGELDEEILNIEKLYQFVLEERIGYIQMEDGVKAYAVALD